MQMADIFGVNPPAISKHIQNIYKEKELLKKSTSSKMELVQNESGRIVKRKVDIYNLDVLIAVGYRINSLVGTKFRQWATRTLRSYIVDGYAINKSRVAKNYQQFLEAVNDIKRLLPSGAVINTESILELVNLFADTWLSLDAYDKDLLISKGVTKKRVTLTADKLIDTLVKLKQVLADRGEATELFGLERGTGNVAGIIGNILQTFSGKELYPSVEEKAAHLLYFMVKNHPFIDGNKRNGAYAFIWFLRQAKILDITRMTPPALTALTILVAESNPKEKDKMIRLILTLLA
jgi:prophage maintenance system killer protein